MYFGQFGEHGESDLGDCLKDGYDACVYALVDPRDNSIRYVGKTCQPKARYRGHLWSSTGAIKAWVKELKAEGLRPSMRIIELCCSTDALFIESSWIRKIGTNRLLNHDWRRSKSGSSDADVVTRL